MAVDRSYVQFRINSFDLSVIVVSRMSLEGYDVAAYFSDDGTVISLDQSASSDLSLNWMCVAARLALEHNGTGSELYIIAIEVLLLAAIIIMTSIVNPTSICGSRQTKSQQRHKDFVLPLFRFFIPEKQPTGFAPVHNTCFNVQH